MTLKENNGLENVAIGTANNEIVSRFGSASAEFLKGLRGHDYEAGVALERGLLDVAQSKVNSDYAQQNIKQQAGFSAEILKVSKDNSENIISGIDSKTFRTEDVSGYGTNHPIADHVALDSQGNLLEISQMKFVNKPEQLIDKIAGGAGGGKNDLSRYMQNDFIDIPSEQVELAKKHAAKQAENYANQAKRALEDGKPELAKNLQQKAENYGQLEGKIRDSNITTNEAIDNRLNPRIETAKNIASVSHRAGIEGAKFGAAVGGTISIVTNIISLSKGDKDFSVAARDTVISTGKAAGVGYVSAYGGSAIKGFMQQSASAGTRALSNTALPALIVTTSLALSESVKQYALGEIDESVLFQQVGQTASGLVASTMGATLGQIALPVPVIGAMVGGMVGHTISGVFYQSYLKALDDAKFAEERYLFIKEKCEAARALNFEYNQSLKALIIEKVTALENEKNELFNLLKQMEELDSNDFATGINQFALAFGATLIFKNQVEFDGFMASDLTFKL